MTRARPVAVVHDLAGRVRLRLDWLRAADGAATAVADHLSSLDGMIEVQVRPFTGSVLCHYDPDRLDAARILTAVRDFAAGLPIEVSGGQARGRAAGRGPSDGSTIARELTRSFAGLNEQMRAVTERRLDLGTLAALTFFGLGIAEVAVTRQLPAPPWFNLAWWAIRTFREFERPVIEGVTAADPGPAARSVRSPRTTRRPRRGRFSG